MKMEKPSSPGHCLKILNENMRTDILRNVHQQVKARMEKRGKKSPLKILIESIEEVLGVFEELPLFESVGPNPFNTSLRHKFNPEADYKHDIGKLF
jgi:hypothetical protein